MILHFAQIGPKMQMGTYFVSVKSHYFPSFKTYIRSGLFFLQKILHFRTFHIFASENCNSIEVSLPYRVQFPKEAHISDRGLHLFVNWTMSESRVLDADGIWSHIPLCWQNCFGYHYNLMVT